jgi:hypothetical protein
MRTKAGIQSRARNRLGRPFPGGLPSGLSRRSARRRGAHRIEPVAPGERLSKRVDENAHLCRQMLAVRIDRRDREHRGWVVPQQGHDGTGSKLLMEVERRNERYPETSHHSEAQQLRVGRNEVSRDAHRERRAVRANEAPLVSERGEGVANAVVGGKIGRARRLGMSFRGRRRSSTARGASQRGAAS